MNKFSGINTNVSEDFWNSEVGESEAETSPHKN